MLGGHDIFVEGVPSRGLGFRVQGLGFRGEGLGFRVPSRDSRGKLRENEMILGPSFSNFDLLGGKLLHGVPDTTWPNVNPKITPKCHTLFEKAS